MRHTFIDLEKATTPCLLAEYTGPYVTGYKPNVCTIIYKIAILIENLPAIDPKLIMTPPLSGDMSSKARYVPLITAYYKVSIKEREISYRIVQLPN